MASESILDRVKPGTLIVVKGQRELVGAIMELSSLQFLSWPTPTLDIDIQIPIGTKLFVLGFESINGQHAVIVEYNGKACVTFYAHTMESFLEAFDIISDIDQCVD